MRGPRRRRLLRGQRHARLRRRGLLRHVTAVDSYCFAYEWDDVCAGEAAVLCAGDFGACGPGAGDCVTENGTPGCDDDACCQIVCTEDPVCCVTEWDVLCVQEALDLCFGPPCPWDCQIIPDGSVNVPDFLALLAQWGQVNTSCDFDGGGVEVTDFLVMLGNWGPCP